jgi:hypothetical protein
VRDSGSFNFEDPCSALQGMFCPTAVLRSDRKEGSHFLDSLAHNSLLQAASMFQQKTVLPCCSHNSFTIGY